MRSKPFVYLLKSPTGYFFFDVNLNQIVPISYDDFRFLSKLTNEEFATLPTLPDTLRELQSMGFLSSNRVSVVKHTTDSFTNLLLSRAMKKITLQITQDCNFRCSYCIYSGDPKLHQRSHSQKKMSLQTAILAVDFLYEHSVDISRINIGFYGGEPLLEFSLIKKIVEYAEKKFYGKELWFSITTNGSLINEEIVEFFIKHNFYVTISMDGPQLIHDKNRIFANSNTGTYDTIKNKLSSLVKKYPAFLDCLSIHMVIDPQNPYEATNFFDPASLGLNSNRLSCSMVDRGDVDISDLSPEQYERECDYSYKSCYFDFLILLIYFKLVHKISVLPVHSKLLELINKNNHSFEPSVPLLPIASPSGPCVPGQARLFVSAQGDLYPCERVSESSDAMKIGNLHDGIDLQKVSDLSNIGALTSEECKNCWAFRLCSICPKCADAITHLSGERKIKYCAASKMNAEHILKEQILLKTAPSYYNKTFQKRRGRRGKI